MSAAVSKAERAEIAERIAEAFDTLRRLPDGDMGRLRVQTMEWPMLIRDANEHGAYKGLRVRRPPPGGAQIDRMHEVLDWMLWLTTALGHSGRDYVAVLYLLFTEDPGRERKSGLPNRRLTVQEIARGLGLHRHTVMRYRDNGLDRIAEYRARRKAA